MAVLAAVFARNGGFGSPQAFVDGMVPAILMGAAFVGLGAVAAFAIPRTRRVPAEQPELRVASPHGGPAVGDPAPVYIRIDE